MTTELVIEDGGEPAAEGELRHVFIETGGGATAPIPDRIRDGLSRYALSLTSTGVGSLTAAENMSVLPNVAGQSVSGAGGAPAVPSTVAWRNVSIAGQTAALRASLNTETAPAFVAATVL